MGALVFVRKKGRLRLAGRSGSRPAERQGRHPVRPVASTTCDLDQAIIHGRTPFPPGFALGHECVAEVVEIGDQVSDVVPGDIVVVPCAPSCGECDVCRAGMTASCEAIGRQVVYGTPFGAAVGGLFSDKVWVPFADAMLVKVPEGVNPIAVSGASDSLTDTYINVTKGLNVIPAVGCWSGEVLANWPLLRRPRDRLGCRQRRLCRHDEGH